MINWRRNLVIVTIGVFIAQIGFSIIVPFLPALLVEVGVERNVGLWSGVVFAVNFLTSSLMAPVWGSLSDRVGKRPMMIRAGLGIAATYGLMAFSHSVWELALWRAVNGLLAGYIPAANTLVASNTPDASLGRALGVLQGVAAAGLITGPLVGGIASEMVGARGTMLLSAGLLLVAGLLPLVLRIEEQVQADASPLSVSGVRAQVRADVREVLQNRTLRGLFAVQLLFTAAQVLVQPTLPLYIARLATHNVNLITGVVYSAVGVATAVGSPLASRFTDRAPLTALRLGLLVSAGVYALHPVVPHTLWLGMIRFAFGLVASLVVVASSVLIATTVEARHRGRTFGVLQAINGLGAVLGPFVGGVLGDVAGLEAPFFAGAATLAAAYVVCPGTSSTVAPSTSEIACLSTEADRSSARSSSGASGRSTMRSMPDRPTTQGMPR